MEPLTDTSIKELVRVAEEAARAGGSVLRSWFGSADLEVAEKGKNDLVSRADKESEAAVVAVLSSQFPAHHILAEEGGASGTGVGEFQWILDPLDGTSNFVHGLPIFCVSVACRKGTELQAAAIYEPIGDRLFLAGLGSGATLNGTPIRVSNQAGVSGAFLATGFPFRAHQVLDAYMSMFRWTFERASGVRRCGAAALDLANTAAGIYDGFFELGLAPWDVAAGALLIREAGGVVSDFDGSDGFIETGNIVAGTAMVQKGLREAFETLVSQEELAKLSSGGNSQGNDQGQ